MPTTKFSVRALPFLPLASLLRLPLPRPRTPFQLSLVPSVPALVMLQDSWSLPPSPSQLCLARTVVVWTHFLACSQAFLVGTDMPSNHGTLSDPEYSHQTKLCPRLMEGLPSFTLHLPYCCKFTWRYNLMAETVFSKPILLPSLRCWLMRSLVQGLCYCTCVPLP